MGPEFEAIFCHPKVTLLLNSKFEVCAVPGDGPNMTLIEVCVSDCSCADNRRGPAVP